MRFYFVLSYILAVMHPPPSPMCLRTYEKDPDHPLDLDGGIKIGRDTLYAAIHLLTPLTSSPTTPTPNIAG